MLDWKKIADHADKTDFENMYSGKKKEVWVLTGNWSEVITGNPICKRGTYAVVIAERHDGRLVVVEVLHRSVKTRREAKWLQTCWTMGEGITEEERNDPDLARLARMMPLGEYFKMLVKTREKKAREKEREKNIIVYK